VAVLGFSSPESNSSAIQLSPVKSETGSLLDPFSSISGRNWFAKKLLTSDECPFVTPVMLFGDGPYEKTEFARFLNNYGLHVYLEDKELEDPEFDDTTPDGEERKFQDWDFYGNMYAPIIICGQDGFDTDGFFSLLMEGAASDKPRIMQANQFTNILHWIERIKLDEGKSIFRRSISMKDLVFISQEMFLACLFTEQLPRLPFGDAWMGHIKMHKALSVVEKIRGSRTNENKFFQWPTTDADCGNGTFGEQAWPQIGMLKYLGYKVGQSGAFRTDRQKTLEVAFTVQELPKVNSQDYVKAWGNASSGVRLKKIADSIAAFCRNARRQNSESYEISIADYETDLAWLKRTYYDGRFDRQFTWPDTQ
jgi:hypothetical protein